MARVMQGLSQQGLSQGLPPVAADAAAALGWLVLAGVDTAVDDGPRNWLAAPPVRRIDVPASSSALDTRKPTRAPASPAISGSAPSIDAQTLDAQTLDAPTLDSLTEAVAGFAHPLRRPGMAPQLLIGNAASGVIIVCEQPEPDGSATAILRSRMLAAIGLDMGNCALLHRLPWPTTGSRTPRADELAAFSPFVARALDLTRPRLLLALGQAAAALAGDTMALSSARGRWADVRIGGAAVPLLATANPRLLLTQPLRKRDAWADLQAFASRLTTTP